MYIFNVAVLVLKIRSGSITYMELWRGSYFFRKKISSVWMFLGAKLVLMPWIHGVYAGTKKNQIRNNEV
ncbi:hypothetical protein DZF84_15310 [Vibrio parahaemolyticus]|nr:hypothetical protein [Vibrio parahaemolyticus]EGR2223500.1 hypothetical protein [Vibrio parahaemolyticus]EGR2252918.1 hypothetical protein [Vibrio parahaemolyticus]EGR3031894.1 hypothetical protein [Vibrio parahaemolyticus]EGR3176329.1 hypothetical protein [Vibrio parahaemolyticus]